MADNPHHDGLVLVYLPKDRILIQADAFTPLAPNASYPTPPNPFSVNLAEMIARHRMTVDTLLPLHGRKVTLTELHKAIGRTPSADSVSALDMGGSDAPGACHRCSRVCLL